jgi:hypothetical protein
MVWKVVRRLLALVIRAFVVHPVIGLTLVVGALGVAGVILSLGGVDSARLVQSSVTTGGVAATPATQAAAPAATTGPALQSAPQVAPPPSVNEYLKGMTTFDSKLMWDALDPQAIQSMTSQGGSQQVLQQRLDEAKQGGARYEDVTYIGGYPLKNGERYFFFVVSRRGFTAPGQLDQVFFVFTVGSNGKIVKIE